MDGIVRVGAAVVSVDKPGRPVLDQTTFGPWVRPHLTVMTAVAVREVGETDADDVVQKAVLRAWQRRSTYRPDRGSPRVWLLTLLLSQARRHRVRGGRHLGLDDQHVQTDQEPGGGSRVDARERQIVRLDVEQAVRQLPRRQREVVTLFYLAELKISEVSQVLGISVGTVKSQLSDARAALHESLETP